MDTSSVPTGEMPALWEAALVMEAVRGILMGLLISLVFWVGLILAFCF